MDQSAPFLLTPAVRLWPRMQIFASGLWVLPWSLSSSLQRWLVWVGRQTSMGVTCESESLRDAARAAVGSLGPHQSLRGRGALLSSQSLRGNGSECVQPKSGEAGEKVRFFCKACPPGLAHPYSVITSQKHILTRLSSRGAQASVNRPPRASAGPPHSTYLTGASMASFQSLGRAPAPGPCGFV